MENPKQLFHGTPCAIHLSDRPFLDPRLAGGRDEGDPQVGHVFATPSLFLASVFAFKNSNCVSIVEAGRRWVIVFDGAAPQPDDEGYVFEVSPKGFAETMRAGQPSGKLAMVEQDMPWVRDADGSLVRGLAVGFPVRHVAFRNLVAIDNVRVCTLANVTRDEYVAAAREAIRTHTETRYINENIERGWIRDITAQYVGVVAFDARNPHSKKAS